MRECACAAYTGLQVDVDRIRGDNEQKKDVERKCGLIIWSGRESQLRHALQRAERGTPLYLTSEFSQSAQYIRVRTQCKLQWCQ